LFLLIKMNMR